MVMRSRHLLHRCNAVFLLNLAELNAYKMFRRLSARAHIAYRQQTRKCVEQPVPGPKKLKNFEARACVGLQKSLDFINKNVRLD